MQPIDVKSLVYQAICGMKQTPKTLVYPIFSEEFHISTPSKNNYLSQPFKQSNKQTTKKNLLGVNSFNEKAMSPN